MQEITAFGTEARASVRHNSLSLRCPYFSAQVGLSGFTEFAFAAFRGTVQKGDYEFSGRWEEVGGGGGGSLLESDDMIAHLHRCHSFPDRFDDPGAFMAEHYRKGAFRVFS